MPGPARALPLLATAIAAMGLLAAGCGGEDGGEAGGGDEPTGLSVRVVPQDPSAPEESRPPAVEPGGTLQARVVNETDETFTYGADYELERRIDGGFEPVELPDRPVIQIAYVAEPGEAGPPVTVEVPKDAKPGPWRVVIARGAPGVEVLAGEFEVTDA